MNYFRILALISIVLSHNIVYGQSINLHSVSAYRYISIEKAEYTLDGDLMILARRKLLNTDNFGPDGTYKKTINMYHGYTETGDLETITANDSADIFFFGSFDKLLPALNQFSDDEIDSLYEWSRRGGKMIIAEQFSYQESWDYRVLEDKWGFKIAELKPAYIYPTELGKTTKIFNGPFGNVSFTQETGMAQGYFSKMPVNSVVLGVDKTGVPTLYLDCNTMDLVVADIGVFDDVALEDELPLSFGDEILNDKDRFLANVFAFMDSIDDVPMAEVVFDGTNLNTGNFNSYQWYRNWDTLNGLNTSSLTPGDDGYYWVVVKNKQGCADSSEVFMQGNITNPVIKCPDDIVTSTDKRRNFATIPLTAPEILDGYGIDTIISDAPDTFFVGDYEITWTVINTEGYSSTCIQQITVFDNEAPLIKCYDDIELYNDSGKSFAVYNISPPQYRENVFFEELIKNTSDTFQIGTTEVVWTAIDSSGNYSQCSQLVTVYDNEAPEIFCPEDILTYTTYGNYYVSVSLDTPTFFENHLLVSLFGNADSLFPIGTTYISWTAVDSSGNKSTCEQAITVVETTELRVPNIITPNGDGLNDYLEIDGLPENTELIIFNDKNQILYKTDNYQNNWDGRDNDGNPILSGTY
ncbi:MAG: HYR domain-containing protein [Bacteroidales bacterium]|nr:HYR domain-containing protein [Bacteroidales bacterium]MBN2819319.1 HYR domain-containing protein [Bacteroidales bacterium]